MGAAGAGTEADRRHPPFVPVGPLFRLTKVDATSGMFRAEVANEQRDGSGERCDVTASLPYFAALEKRCLAESGGKKVAPLREMHQLIAAGNVTEFLRDPEGKTVGIVGKITDANTLAKAVEGTLSGVSMGGLKRYLGFDPDGARRYEARPKEISLVDMGDLIGSGIEMLNAAGGFEVLQPDGTTVRRLYKAGYAEEIPTGEEATSLGHLVDRMDHHVRHGAQHLDDAAETAGKIADLLPTVSPDAAAALESVRSKRGKEKPMRQAARTDDPSPKEGADKYGDVTFADAENKKYPIDTEAHVRAAWNYINKASNAAKYKDGGRAVKRKIIAEWKAKVDAAGPPSAKSDGEMKKAAYAGALAAAFGLRKNAWGFNLAGRLAEILGQLCDLSEMQRAEEEREGDDTALCVQLDRAIATLGDVAVAMLEEEVGEIAEYDDDGNLTGMTNAADALRGFKARVQKMHNMASEMGATCSQAMTQASTGTSAAAAAGGGEDDMLTAEQLAELNKAVGGAVENALGIKAGAVEAEGVLIKTVTAAVTGALTPALEPMQKAIGEAMAKLGTIEARLKNIEDEPKPTAGALLALGKAADSAGEAVAASLGEKALRELGRENPARLARLLSQEPGNAYHIDTVHGVTPINPA